MKSKLKTYSILILMMGTGILAQAGQNPTSGARPATPALPATVRLPLVSHLSLQGNLAVHRYLIGSPLLPAKVSIWKGRTIEVTASEFGSVGHLKRIADASAKVKAQVGSSEENSGESVVSKKGRWDQIFDRSVAAPKGDSNWLDPALLDRNAQLPLEDPYLDYVFGITKSYPNKRDIVGLVHGQIIKSPKGRLRQPASEMHAMVHAAGILSDDAYDFENVFYGILREYNAALQRRNAAAFSLAKVLSHLEATPRPSFWSARTYSQKLLERAREVKEKGIPIFRKGLLFRRIARHEPVPQSLLAVLNEMEYLFGMAAWRDADRVPEERVLKGWDILRSSLMTVGAGSRYVPARHLRAAADKAKKEIVAATLGPWVASLLRPRTEENDPAAGKRLQPLLKGVRAEIQVDEPSQTALIPIAGAESLPESVELAAGRFARKKTLHVTLVGYHEDVVGRVAAARGTPDESRAEIVAEVNAALRAAARDLPLAVMPTGQYRLVTEGSKRSVVELVRVSGQELYYSRVEDALGLARGSLSRLPAHVTLYTETTGDPAGRGIGLYTQEEMARLSAPITAPAELAALAGAGSVWRQAP